MKRAVILAGGQGVRLRPFTYSLPKPLMPIGKLPILEIIIKQLSRNNFNHITIAVNHHAEIIQAFFGNGSKWNLKIDYSQESKPLSTMAPLKLIKDLPENFLVMNGDILTDLNFSELYEYHINNKNIFTISSYTRNHVNDYGVLLKDESCKLIDFKEKPVTRFEVSMGVYIANHKVLSVIPNDTFYGFDNLMLDLIMRKTPASVLEFHGIWFDIGRPDDYERANELFENELSSGLL
jgi:NDP-sugar pyrophosphorylase family protein